MSSLKEADGISVIDGKDAATSLLTSSPHRDNISIRGKGSDVFYSSQCLLRE